MSTCNIAYVYNEPGHGVVSTIVCNFDDPIDENVLCEASGNFFAEGIAKGKHKSMEKLVYYVADRIEETFDCEVVVVPSDVVVFMGRYQDGG